MFCDSTCDLSWRLFHIEQWEKKKGTLMLYLDQIFCLYLLSLSDLSFRTTVSFHAFYLNDLSVDISVKWSHSVMSNSLQPVDCSPPSSFHGILQARILEWVAFPSPRSPLLLLHCFQFFPLGPLIFTLYIFKLPCWVHIHYKCFLSFLD